MTNEKMLKKMYDLSNYLENGSYVKETVLQEIINDLKEDIRADCQKKVGNGKRDVLIKKLMKSAKNPVKPDRGTHYIPVDEMFGFCDGYRAYVLKDDYGYPKTTIENYLNLKNVKPKNAKMKVYVDLVDVQMLIKDHKAKKEKKMAPYKLDAGEFEIYFNPEYLLEFCKMFQTDFIMCESSLSPALYEAKNGEWGVLLPVRKNQ